MNAAASAQGALVDFTCNVCGTPVKNCPRETIDREISSCPECRSSVRFRSIVHLVSMALFGRSVALPQFPVNRGTVGIGLSDWDGYARGLAEKFDYTNMYFHQPPLLDICQPVGALAQTSDFLISTEVFEHVVPPAARAFQGAFDLLKPGGHLILTVPFTNEPATTEHFPELHDYRVVQFDDKYVLLNRTADGKYAVHDDLVFHGGPGTTLEMRVFCRQDVIAQLTDAGFTNIEVFEKDVPEWGILHKQPWSLPILARRPAHS